MLDELTCGRKRIKIYVTEPNGIEISSVSDRLGPSFHRLRGVKVGDRYKISRMLNREGEIIHRLFGLVLREVDPSEPLALALQSSRADGCYLASGRWYEIHAD